MFEAVPAHKKKAMRHAAVMLLCVSLLLALFYTQHRPYLYADPHQAIFKAVHQEETLGFDSVDEIWPWLLGVLTALGGDTFKLVEANCAPSSPNSQPVVIDGLTYTLFNPDTPTSSCSNTDYITSLSEKPVILSGNFQLLLLGLFTERAQPEYANSNGLAANLDTTLSTYDDMPTELSSSKDWNVVTVCNAPWDSTTPSSVSHEISTQCVLEDNFGEAAGSTFKWKGDVKRLDGTERYIFQNTSSVISRLGSHAEGFTTLYPCFSSSTNPVTSEESLASGNPYFSFNSDSSDNYGVTNCSHTWMSKGSSIRGFCLDAANQDTTALQSFAAGMMSYNTTTELMDDYFSCSALNDFTATELQNVYLKSAEALSRHIDKYMDGVFVPVLDERNFLLESYRKYTLLMGHNVIDRRYTRTFRMNMILRNVQKKSMYYTILHCDIKINDNGNVRPSFTMSHVPIVQFVYGAGDYPWFFRQIVTLECITLLLFGLFFLRELKQITLRLYRYWKKVERRRKSIGAPVVPLSTDNLNTTAVIEMRENTSNDDDKDGKPAKVHHASSLKLTNIQDIENGATSSNVKSIETTPDDQPVTDFTLPDSGSFVYDLIDWATIACFITAIVFRVRYIIIAEELHTRIKAGLVEDNVEDKLDAIVRQFNELEVLFRSTNFLALILCFIGFSQFFRYLSFDKRLGIVTKTMKDSFVDLFPVMLIYCFIMLAYGVLGTSLYGHESQYFKTLGDSLTTLSLIVLGEVAGPYYEMHAIASYQTVWYYWTFIILIGFVLLNMVLAVIFKVYDDTCAEIAKKDKKVE